MLRHIEPERLFEDEYICAQIDDAILRQRSGYTEVRNVWILNWLSEEYLRRIVERHFEVSKPQPHFHKWELRRKDSIYFPVVSLSSTQNRIGYTHDL